MARPVYILWAQSAAEDKESGLYSFFEVVEKIELRRPPAPKEGEYVIRERWHPLRIVAVWMIEPEKGDRYEDEYEWDFRLFMPPDGELIPLGSGTFKFGEPEPRPFHRFPAYIQSPLPLRSSGVLRAESRILKAGTKTWLSQDCPVIVEIIQVSDEGEARGKTVAAPPTAEPKTKSKRKGKK
jgi:hypothetical protein